MPLPGENFFGLLKDKPLNTKQFWKHIYPTPGKIVKASPYLSMTAPLFQSP